MEDALAVQVLEPSGDVQRQTDPHTPGQVQVAVQQLLQVTSIDVLQRTGFRLYSLSFHAVDLLGANARTLDSFFLFPE